jgi:hypothetical protein
MATSKKTSSTAKPARQKGVVGILRCRPVFGSCTSVSIINDVGGTSTLPAGDYPVRLLRSWYDEETGVRWLGNLLDAADIETARRAGTTGLTPKDYRATDGARHYNRVLAAAREFDPGRVYFSDWDFTPDAHERAA